ncbi:hypothetical protein L596_029217 [Steinernema carpocapsae]|uniref:ShKT domain-containing protein n=1 Tax=Steinernema carpocapsae TaxID=34508 RepID=A0A4V6XVL6_STECR|nr:hypothetical protein L596_029217 [Steinernema carpocapsae]
MPWRVLLFSALFVPFASATAATPPPPCTDKFGNLLPGAMSCEDDIGGCAEIFKTKAEESPAKRDPLCENAALKEIVSQCSKTCARCCQNPKSSCPDHPAYAFNCPNWKNSCGSTTESVRDTMALFCPGTCGLCMAGKCRDEKPDCHKQLLLCYDPISKPIWAQQCARTCGTCPQLNPQPPANPSPPPGPLPPAPAPNPNCGDAPKSPCAQFKIKGFCENTYYDMAFRMKTCGRTCGWC